MIASLEFPDGHDMPAPTSLRQHVRDIIVASIDDLIVLDPGTYDITPKLWTRNTHAHELVVLDNGTGLYRLIPKYDDSGSANLTRSGSQTFQRGGRTSVINAENPQVLVAGGHSTKRGLHIFNILTYLDIQI